MIDSIRTAVRDSLTGLVNSMTGTGTERDKQTAASWYFAEPDVIQLQNAYRSNWLTRKIVDVPASDILRQGWRWQATSDVIEKLTAAERRLKVKQRVLRASRFARLYGGSAIILGDGAADPLQPISPATVKNDGLRYLAVFSRYQISAHEGGNFLDDTFEWSPEYYEVQTVSGRPVRLHPSRVILFHGNDSTLEEHHNQIPWGDSVLIGAMDGINAAAAGTRAFGRMMDESTVSYHQIKDLMTHLSTDEGTTKVKRAIELMEQMKSAVNAMAVDSDATSVMQFAPQFAGMPEAMQTVLQIVSGAADIPVTRLLGQSPAGMNATGESDLQNYYDRLKSDQELELDPRLDKIHELLTVSSVGKSLDSLTRVQNPLWQLSEKEQAEVDASIASTLNTYSTGGLVPDKVLERIAKTELQESRGFQGAEDAWDGFEEGDEDGDDIDQEVEEANRIQAGDAAPRTLYVRRDVKNAEDIIAWANEQGIDGVIAPEELHVTIAHSKVPVDWMKAGDSWEEEMEIAPGGARLMEKMGATQDALALLFVSSRLSWRHETIKESGAVWEWPEYQPHITISYRGADADLSKIEPYRGRIILGHEVFEEVNEDWKARVAGR